MILMQMTSIHKLVAKTSLVSAGHRHNISRVPVQLPTLQFRISGTIRFRVCRGWGLRQSLGFGVGELGFGTQGLSFGSDVSSQR